MAVWNVQLLGGLRATRGHTVLAQFPARPVAMLLARLALQPERRHAREELIDLLWPDAELEVGRNRFRQVLSTLRRLLEPPDVPPDSVLVADRLTVGFAPDAVACDAAEFERLLRKDMVGEALELYRGELLPGFIDEWVDEERLRLSALHDRALTRSRLAGAKSRDTASTAADKPQPSRQPVAPARFLPSYVSVFFGRERDKRRVLEALGSHRLVTLIGLGGFGKTRLAVESARAVEGFDTVAFVGLSEVADAALIGDAVRSALRMEASQEDALAQVAAFLSDRDVLLVLDNFEQLVEEGARVLMEILERIPRLRALVTSRRALDLPGEHLLAVEPLPIPESSMAAADAVATPSVALFIDRARGARADFALTDDNRAALIELCRSLEGLPLAIEIAASRIRAYSPREMCAALAERFELLTRSGPRATRYGRHMSLQSAIEWSWNLLSEPQQTFFAALSVFRGTFSADAVAAVCEAKDARAGLDALVADSLLRSEVDASDVTRFSMLDTLREFAGERVGGASASLRARHRAYFLELARETGAEIAVAEGEMPNLRHALMTAVEDGDPARALEMGVALRPYWETHGVLPDELRALSEAAERCPRAEPSLHVGLNLLARLSLVAGEIERARACAERALADAGGEPALRAAALVTLAHVSWERDQRSPSARTNLDEALALAADAGALDVEADALRVKGTVALKHGESDADYRDALALFERAEALYRRIDEPRWAHRALLSRVGCLTGLERYDDARRLLEQCERYFVAIDSVADLIAVANMTGYLESGQEHWQEAIAAGRRCVQLAWERHAHLPLAMALWNLPHALAMREENESAARLMAFAARFWERSIGSLSKNDLATLEQVRKRAVKALGATRTGALWGEGAALTLAQAVDLALMGHG